MRVAVYAIALDEQAHVGRFLASVRAADVVVVADTGSTDGTIEALRAGGVEVHSICIRPWRFDDARNAALALVPGDIDVCIPLDLDEVLADGWRVALDTEWGDATRGTYRYTWSHLDDGSPGTTFWYDRIHARAPEGAASYRYLGRCLAHLGRVDEAIGAFRYATEEHADAREPWIELAQGLHDAGRWEECAAAAERALAVTERSGDYLSEPWAWGGRADDLLSIAAWHIGDRNRAVRHAERAAALEPHDARIRANLDWLRTAAQ